VNPAIRLSGIAQARLVREGDISSEDLIRAHLDQIGHVNPRLNAVVELLEQEALQAAKAVDAKRARGGRLRLFEGVPFSVKDSIEVAGTICSAGTLGRRNAARSQQDATVVGRLRAAGAIPLARTNLPDLLFAFESDNLIFGRTNNPYDLSRTSGGSSGGEAALIAAVGSPFGLGSDAAGSVRVPAHFCGIASLKPTSGRLPRTGHVPPAGGWIEMLWQIGPMARWVEDLDAMMRVLTGPDGEDRTVVPMPYRSPAEVDLDRLRILNWEDIDDPHISHRRAYGLEMKILGADGGDSIRRYLKAIGSTETHPLLEGWLGKLDQYRTDALGFAHYWDELDDFRNRMFALLRNYDAILSPVCEHLALPHGESTRDDIFPGFGYTMVHNLTGWPAAVVRRGTSTEALPRAVQIAAAPWREDIVLALANAIEQESGGWSLPESLG
jgi:amidase